MQYGIYKLALQIGVMRVRFLRLCRLMVRFLLVCAVISNPVNAQNSTVIGADSFGAECFKASQIATSTGSANRADLESCDRAIVDGGLRGRDLVATYVNRGVIHMAMRNTDSALADLNRALELDDDTGEAYVNRGNLWFFGNNLANAVADYNLALELGVEKPHIAHLNRGMAQEQLGKFEHAKSDYKAALRYVKGWSQAQLRLERVEEKIRKKKRDGR